MLYRFVAQISLDRRFHWRACSHRHGAACADGFSKPATSPARSTIDWKPWLVNGVPRSLINTFYEQYSSIYQFLESKREVGRMSAFIPKSGHSRSVAVGMSAIDQ